MKISKNLKKSIVVSLLTAMIAMTGIFVFAGTASAEDDKTWCQKVQDSTPGFKISCGEDQVSFTKFEGGFTPPKEEGYSKSLTRVTTVRSFVLTFVNFALSFLGLIAVVIVIYGGVLYVTARGEQEQADKGKKSIQYAVVGILIILGSFALVNTLLTETFSEENVQNASGDGPDSTTNSGGTHNSSNLGSTGVFGGYNSLTSKVRGSATTLIDTYGLFQTIQSDVKALNTKITVSEFEITSKGYNSVKDYLNNAKSILSNIQNNIPIGASVTNDEVELAINKILKVQNEIEIANAEQITSAAAGEEATQVLDAWEKHKPGLIQSYEEIIKASKEDFKSSISAAKTDLEDIKKSISDSLAEINGMITNLLSDQFGLGKLEKAIDSDQNADNIMLNIVSLYNELFTALDNIQFVRAVISADVVEGNAPLLVNFNMLNSVDPSGETISDEQIKWDLNGDGAFGEAVSSEIAQNCEENASKTFVSCTYIKPGAYKAAVRIESSKKEAHGAGQAGLTVKVLPPTARIGLEVSTSYNNSTKDPTNLIEYDKKTGAVLYEKKSTKFTLSEAKSGIIFDSSTTESEDAIVSYSYDFGDGTEETFGDNKEPVVHAYGDSGVYKVRFEVTDDKGKKNRKLFDVIVGSPVARILVNPRQNAYLGEEVFFNGTTSSSEVGQVVSYEWKIEGVDEDITSDESSFRHTFEKDGEYKVSLTVTDSLQEKDTDISILSITSQAPVSKFSYEMPSKSQPAEVHLYGTKSYDPDGDITDANKYTYKWTITPNTFTPIDGTDETLNRVVRFDEKGEYKVSLLVQDKTPQKQGKAFEKTIEIDDILDVKWSPNQEISKQLNSNGEAQITFSGLSNEGAAYEVNFGDGESEGGAINGGKFSETYTYTESGKYDVTLTVFDEDDNDKSVTKRIYIGDGTKPTAAIKVFVNGQEKNDLDSIEANRSSVVTFDAGDSKNTDGTGRKLLYSWDFDDTNVSSKKTATHTFKEINSKGYYQVQLTVTDKDDQSLKDTEKVKIHIISEWPELLGLTAVPQTTGQLVTPLKVKVNAIGAEDKDGDIVKYRWFYYPTSSSSEELGLQINESPSVYMNIGTRGKEGKDVTYRFDVEITDNENNTVLASDILSKNELPTLTVTNGPNELPMAKFKVDRTNIFTGEEITFSSDSNDPDGEIMSYSWDFEGDGFSNNKITKNTSITHTYTKSASKGIQVRLKVIDDKFGESVSDPITIYVESATEPPVAAFKYKLAGDKEVEFENNSSISDGPAIKEYKWDFNTSVDSDGDGKKDNDVDSISKTPVWEAPEYGIYKAKLTVVDGDGNEDSVENFVNVPAPTGSELPKAAFKFQILEVNKVHFINNSVNQAGPQIVKYIWDFDVNSEYQIADSDGDGIKDNDVDSTATEPDFSYPAKAAFQVKLTAIDAAGNEDSVINFVDLANPDPGLVVFGNEISVTGIVKAPTTFTGSQGKLEARLLTTPEAYAKDGKIHIIGDSGEVLFDFSTSTGVISKYIIDKNIFFDTDGNGVPNDDKDMNVMVPGTWKTNFDKSWGKTVVKLTVYDKLGNSDTVLKEIVFDNPGAASIIQTNPKDFFTALVTLLAFVILSFGIYRFQKQ